MNPFSDVPKSMVIDQDITGQQNLMDFDWLEEETPENNLNNPSSSRQTRAAKNIHDYTSEEMNAKAEHQRAQGREAQARYRAKKKAQQMQTENRFKSMSSEIDQLQMEIQQGLALEKALTARSTFKDAALELLHSRSTTAPSTTSSDLGGGGGRDGVINNNMNRIDTTTTTTSTTTTTAMFRNDSTAASAQPYGPPHFPNPPTSSSKVFVPACEELRGNDGGDDPISSQTTSPSASADNTTAAEAAAATAAARGQQQQQSSLLLPPSTSDSQQQEGGNEGTEQKVESRQIPPEISRILQDTLDTYAVQLGSPPSLSPERELEIKSQCQRMTVDEYMGWWTSFRDECAELSKKSKEPDVDVTALEQAMKTFWNQRVARFGIILNIRPDLVKELVASAVMPAKHTEEEWREVIIQELELSEEQMVQFERVWREFEKEMEEANKEGQEALQSLRILTSQGSIPTTDSTTNGQGSIPTTDSTTNGQGSIPTTDSTTNGTSTTVPHLPKQQQGFLTMQDLMEAYVMLSHTTGRLETWEQRQFIGSLKLLNCFASITTLTQKSRMPALVGPTFPDFISIMGILGRRKEEIKVGVVGEEWMMMNASIV